MNEDVNNSASREEEVGEWTYLGREIVRRTKQPWNHVPLVLYVLVAIVVFGGLGIWVEIVKISTSDEHRGTGELFAAMATFYPALVGASAVTNDFCFVGQWKQDIGCVRDSGLGLVDSHRSVGSCLLQ